MRPWRSLLAALIFLAAAASVQASGCGDLAALGSTRVKVLSAQEQPAGTLSLPDDGHAGQRLPAFCRVRLQFMPTADSHIGAEVWLPHSWNGKLLMVGSGGWGGSVNVDDMAEAVRRGYATGATDDGHVGPGASFALGHPEKLIDFAYRAQHETTLEAKALIGVFYQRAPTHAYWQGCSGGGREGLIQAYRYPEEFDGIIAGDPANIRRNAWALWIASQAYKDPAAYIAPSKYPMIHRAVLAQCDAKDGLKDGLIDDPRQCRVDFSVLQCRAGDGPDCLTGAQIRTANMIVSPASTADGKELFPRLEPGTELRWARLAGGPQPADLFLDEFRYLVYQDPHWDWHGFELERDAAKAHAIDQNVDELDPRLTGFAKRGGKLLLYHGWADQQVAPGSSIEFYEAVRRLSAEPARIQEWARLFMAPGMAHCAGGEGPDEFDSLSALEQWVEHNKPPDRIMAERRIGGVRQRSRPLCPYPQVARYSGTGSIDEAGNFACRNP